jgi:glycosyltransferase involved in cell wall biosynthesis
MSSPPRFAGEAAALRCAPGGWVATSAAMADRAGGRGIGSASPFVVRWRDPMKVSAIIPVFNGARFLRQAIDSVLAQTHALHEIIVVDGGSTDSSPQILASYGDRLNVISQENRGVAVARNVGLENASGELVAFLDQDDLWPEDRTAMMVGALAARPDVEVVAGLVAVLYERQCPPWLTGIDLAPRHRENFLGSLCLRAGVFQILGLLNTQVGHADDIEFYWRRRDAGTSTLRLDQVTLVYRIHEHNSSADRDASRQHFLAAVHASSKRRRTGKNEDKLHSSGL